MCDCASDRGLAYSHSRETIPMTDDMPSQDGSVDAWNPERTSNISCPDSAKCLETLWRGLVT